MIAPFFVFGPRRLRLIAGVLMAGFQIVLILSGNLAFLNWLTLVPILACFDDDACSRVPRRLREWLRARMRRRRATVVSSRSRIGASGSAIVAAARSSSRALALVLSLAVALRLRARQRLDGHSCSSACSPRS